MLLYWDNEIWYNFVIWFVDLRETISVCLWWDFSPRKTCNDDCQGTWSVQRHDLKHVKQKTYHNYSLESVEIFLSWHNLWCLMKGKYRLSFSRFSHFPSWQLKTKLSMVEEYIYYAPFRSALVSYLLGCQVECSTFQHSNL